jgi:O-antigen/teichoic acid export membrane protein
MLSQKLILSYGSRLVIQFLQIGASIVVARVAGPTVLGTVAFGLAFVSLFEFVADLGIGPAHMKLVSEGQDIGKCISTYAVLKLCNTSLFFLLVLSIFLFQKCILNFRFESSAHESVIIIMLFAATVNQLLFIPKITFAGRTEQAKQSIPEFIRILVYQILRVVVVLLGYKAVALALGNLLSTLLIVPLVLYLFKNYPRDKFDRELAGRYLRISLPLLLIGMSTHVIMYVDKVVLQYFTSSAQVGYYTAGYRIGSLVLIIATSAGHLFFPLFSEAAANENFSYIKNTIVRFEKFSFIFIMPGILFLSLYSDVIIGLLLGSQYSASVPVMTVINVAMFLMVLNMPYGNVLTGMGYFRVAAIINVLNLLVFFGFIFVLPNPALLNLGAVGVAVAVLVSNVFIGCLYRIFAKRKCPVINLNKSIRFFVFGVITFIVFNALYSYLSLIFGAIFKIYFIFLYFGATYGFLLVIGWIRKDDLKDLKEIANLGKMASYIKGEIRDK